MITFDGKTLTCDCGNKDQKRFAKYIGSRNVQGIRKRILTVKYEAVICNQCDQVIDDNELARQISGLNTKRNEEKAKAEAETKAQETVQGEAEADTSAGPEKNN